MIDPLLDELRRQYRESAHERLEVVRALLRADLDPESLGSLIRHFHAFSGMGATYGFPRISEVGDELEASAGRFKESGTLPDAGTVARWRELVREIAIELC